jgi:iron complex outermembrane receptor protein
MNISGEDRMKVGLLVSTALAGALTSMPAASQAVQAAPQQSNGSADSVTTDASEIIVTAQKRLERLQDVPKTVNVVTGDAIQKLNLRSFTEIAQLAPGLSLEATEPSTSKVTLRGVGFDPGSASSPTVDAYFNETPLDLNSAFRALYDVGQIEVLRGPQGTLRGRTSPSGAITIASRRPDLRDIGGYAQQTLTTQDGINTQGALNVPIVNDVLAVRVAGLLDRNDGLGGRDISNGVKDRDRTESGRLSVVFRPVSNLTLNATYQYLNNRSTSTYLLFTLPGQATDPILTPGDRTAKATLPGHYSYKSNLVTWSADWDLGDATLSYVGGYQDIDRGRNADLAAGGSIPGFSQNQTFDSHLHQISQELRIASTGTRFWNYLFGAYYDRDTGNTNVAQPQFIPIGTVFPRDLLTLDAAIFIPSKTNTRAVFTDQRFQLTDKLQVQVGLRYQESRRNSDFVVTLSGPLFPAPVTTSNISPENRRATYRQLTGGASVKYDFSRDLTAYASYGRSYRPGGVNAAGARVDESLLLFRPETSDSYEVGLKGSLFDRKVSFSLAAYQQDFKNYLAYTGSYLAVSEAKDGSVSSNAAFTFNADARIRGIEATINGQIGNNLTLGASATYNDAKFRNAVVPCNDFNGDGVADSVGTPHVPVGQNVSFCRQNGRLSDQASWGLSINGEYHRPVGGGRDFFLRALANYVPKRTDPFQNVRYNDLLNNSVFIGVRAANDSYELSLFGKNLANVATLTSRGSAQLDYSFIPTGYSVGVPVRPREFGIIGRYKF